MDRLFTVQEALWVMLDSNDCNTDDEWSHFEQQLDPAEDQFDDLSLNISYDHIGRYVSYCVVQILCMHSTLHYAMESNMLGITSDKPRPPINRLLLLLYGHTASNMSSKSGQQSLFLMRAGDKELPAPRQQRAARCQGPERKGELKLV